ncbi:MAG: GNAT family N-acetyltransferase [Chloroflexi bacterium]|nr:GNAT family N-acetyltransferase [Chloroflexota bacterium]
MLEMRTVTTDEFVQWLHAEARAHGNRLDVDPEVLRPHFDLDRSIAVFDQGNIIGGAHSHRVEMSIPGASAVTAGVANIAVQPTHTRRGVMTRMMHHQINDIHERGEPLAALFARESIIYRRFGYGIGSLHERWMIDRQYNGYARPYESPGRIVFVDLADITKELPEVFRRSTMDRPGVFQRSIYQWERDSQAPEHSQGGPGGMFYAAYEDGGTLDGYVTYRIIGTTLVVNELMAATKEANAALWRFCFDVDLLTCTEALKRPVDDPLPWMLADPRRLQRSTRDGMWVRLIDVSVSLELRRYMQSDRLVLEVRDELCPWNEGRFELEGSSEGATCRPSSSSPDLVLAVSDLASVYLGTVNFSTLSQAGLVDECTPGALLRADRMFAVRYQPWTPVNF